MKFKLGDIVRYKPTGCIGVIVQDYELEKLVVRIHPHIFGEIEEDDWELHGIQDR